MGKARGAGPGAARDGPQRDREHPPLLGTQPTALGHAVSDPEGPGLSLGGADRVAAPGFSRGC